MRPTAKIERRKKFWRNKAKQSGTVEMAEGFWGTFIESLKWRGVEPGFMEMAELLDLDRLGGCALVRFCAGLRPLPSGCWPVLVARAPHPVAWAPHPVASWTR
jgi:hypothetical protein